MPSGESQSILILCRRFSPNMGFDVNLLGEFGFKPSTVSPVLCLDLETHVTTPTESPMWSPSQIAEKREAKRKSGAFLFLNLWPFAAILMFLLLIFLSDYVPIDFPHRAAADLPKSGSASRQPGARREDAIRITVTRDGAVYLGDTYMRLQELGAAVQSAIRDGAEKKVYISADAQAKNIDVERVVDELGRAGIKEISFLTAQQ